MVSERLIREDIFTSFFAKRYIIIRRNTKYGPEIFTPSPQNSKKKQTIHLDENGIVKVGSKVKGDDILVGKVIPCAANQHEKSDRELFLDVIFGRKSQNFTDDSLYLPSGEEGVVYKVEKRDSTKIEEDELEIVEVYVVHERKLEIGDKLTTRFGNKGIVAKIVPEIDMPFDEEGNTIDIIFNPLGVPTRMNIGQLLETIVAYAAHKLNIKLLVRPFSDLSLEIIKELTKEAKLKNLGSQKLFDGKTGLPFHHEVYNGYIYVVKLNHMVADKIHARSTDSYSLIYQQPLKGRVKKGGQRSGEMEC